ncbi:MAG TPA: Dabb family protein [Candidatus Dormibacteraeota bacterium]
MIRNVTLIKFKPGTTPEQIDRIENALLAMGVPGTIHLSVGRDAGLREGNMDAAVVSDHEDEEAYRSYDQDPEHNRIRRELVGPVTERVERVQYRI